MKYTDLEAQIIVDAKEALWKYGETLDIRRESLHSLFQKNQAPITRVRLIYEGKAIWAKSMRSFKSAMLKAEEVVRGVEVLSQ